MIFNQGKVLQTQQEYTVTCESVDAEFLHADIDDIFKLLKNEKRVLRFLNDQYQEKYPNMNLTDIYFDQVFSSKNISKQGNGSTGQQIINSASLHLSKPKKLSLMPVQRNLIQYGIGSKVNKLLLN